MVTAVDSLRADGGEKNIAAVDEFNELVSRVETNSTQLRLTALDGHRPRDPELSALVDPGERGRWALLFDCPLNVMTPPRAFLKMPPVGM